MNVSQDHQIERLFSNAGKTVWFKRFGAPWKSVANLALLHQATDKCAEGLFETTSTNWQRSWSAVLRHPAMTTWHRSLFEWATTKAQRAVRDSNWQWRSRTVVDSKLESAVINHSIHKLDKHNRRSNAHFRFDALELLQLSNSQNLTWVKFPFNLVQTGHLPEIPEWRWKKFF